MGKGPITETLEALNLTKRSKTLGVPTGSQRPDWVKIGLIGAGVASSVAGGVKAKRGAKHVAERVREPAEKAKGVVDKASDVGDKASDIGEKASSVSEAVSEKSNPVSKAAAAVKELGDGGSSSRNVKKLRLIINEHVDVGVPRRTAYNQWTQFEDLPTIIKGVDSVDQEEDDVAKWTAKIGPSRRQWTAEIDEQTPDERIVWHSTDGAENRGSVSFHQLDGNLTRVQVEMEYFPSGLIEKIGNIFLVARRRVRKDLRLFKHYMELAGEESGAWRGEIYEDEEGRQVDAPDDGEARDETQDQDEQSGTAEDAEAQAEEAEDEQEDAEAQDEDAEDKQENAEARDEDAEAQAEEAEDEQEDAEDKSAQDGEAQDEETEDKAAKNGEAQEKGSEDSEAESSEERSGARS